MSIELTVENVCLRQEAVQKTRKHFCRLLGMMLVILLCTGLLDTGLTALGDFITGPETEAAVAAISSYAGSEGITSTAPMAEAVAKVFTSPKFWLFNLFYIVVTSLVTHGMELGRHVQLLAAGRGDKPKVLGGFSRMRYCFKAWRLTIWIAIKVFLWALPGLACLLIGAELQTYGQLALGDIMIFAGVGLLPALTIRAGLSYCMSTFILADEPDRGVRECVTLSKGLMQYRRWQAFKLGMPMILKMIGVVYVSMMVFSLIGAAIGTAPASAVASVVILLMLLALGLPIAYFGLQFDLVNALFYLKRRAPADKSTSYWLRDHTDADTAPAEQDASESPNAPAESPVDPPEDTVPENTEEKESPNEEPVC